MQMHVSNWKIPALKILLYGCKSIIHVNPHETRLKSQPKVFISSCYPGTELDPICSKVLCKAMSWTFLE